MIEITTGTTKKFLEDINANFTEIYNSIPNISFGQDKPDNIEGEDGDIYIQYEA